MIGFISIFLLGATMASVKPDFVSLRDFCPGVIVASHYATTENFTGEVVAGYLAKSAYMARIPAVALKQVLDKAQSRGYTIKVFDSYRPVKAVAFFQLWAQRPETNPQVQAIYYPKYSRKELFDLGYIAKRSSHSRGSAIDLTLVNMKSGLELDMGTGFDYFDELSHTASTAISSEQAKNRALLKDLMEGEGFQNFSQEWWHFSFKPEPYPDTYFDFDVN